MRAVTTIAESEVAALMIANDHGRTYSLPDALRKGGDTRKDKRALEKKATTDKTTEKKDGLTIEEVQDTSSTETTVTTSSSSSSSLSSPSTTLASLTSKQSPSLPPVPICIHLLNPDTINKLVTKQEYHGK